MTLLFFQEACRLLSPFVLRLLLEHLSVDPEGENVWQGLLYALSLSLCGFCFVIFNSHMFYASQVLASQLRSAYSTAIYRKVMYSHSIFFLIIIIIIIIVIITFFGNQGLNKNTILRV